MKEAAANTKNHSIRVKERGKNSMDKFLDSIKKSEFDSPITYDLAITFLCENATEEDRNRLLLRALKWDDEERRLRHVWEKKNGKVSDRQWREKVGTGQLLNFFEKHSRIKLEGARRSA